MSRPGRPPGPLKGRTSEANALARFLRELTAEDTVSQLEERYRLSRSVWSEYRSGAKIIPLARLNQIIENRYPRDARTRTDALQQARRLHTAATTAASAPAPTPATPPTPTPVILPGPLPTTRPEEATSPAGSAALPQPGHQAVDAPDISPPPRERRSPASGRAPWTGRRGRWSAPAQWAALAALVAVLVIANHYGGSSQTSDAASSPGDTAQEQPIAAPAPPNSSATLPPSSSAPQSPPPVPSGWHVVRANVLRLAVAVPDGWRPDVDNALQSTWVSPDDRYVIGVKRDDTNGHTAQTAAQGQLAWYAKTEESKMMALTARTYADTHGGKEAARLELDYHWPARETPCHRTELFVAGDGGQVYQLLVNDQQYDEASSDLPQLLSTARAQWRTDLTD
ncbi:hypothetical protein OG264_00925 [Streptomyces xanthophaeus]|uniref:hypothetical protein n=1 Tax=Streptomyces xanthophaeus TaxID=67385 RepID=UPI0038672450|nr:hypothetical protein OG264_00925 [Streptomyces xanthophaeus]WST64841.1 hypothetical protein OG605_37435 [Streptomyces xanthophaeus]